MRYYLLCIKPIMSMKCPCEYSMCMYVWFRKQRWCESFQNPWTQGSFPNEEQRKNSREAGLYNLIHWILFEILYTLEITKPAPKRHQGWNFLTQLTKYFFKLSFKECFANVSILLWKCFLNVLCFKNVFSYSNIWEHCIL